MRTVLDKIHTVYKVPLIDKLPIMHKADKNTKAQFGEYIDGVEETPLLKYIRSFEFDEDPNEEIIEDKGIPYVKK